MLNEDYWPTQDWRTIDPESLGMSAEPLFDIEQEINARFRSINAFLIVRKGYLVYESYYNGFGRDNKQLLASVTKSFISALIGIAIDQGFIEGVDQHVLDFFPDFEPDPRDYLKHQMAIKHLLTMTAGFQWRTGPRADEQLIDRLRRSKDWVAFILNLPVRERLMGTFQYNSACSHLLSAIITRSTGRCAEEFAADNLFESLGIDQPDTNMQHTYSQADVFRNTAGGWPKDPQGNSIGGWGLFLKPRDMARFGFLYLNRGQWDGGQIIQQEWIEDSISPHTPDYGYQ